MCFNEDSLPAADAKQDETEDDGSEDNEECVGRARRGQKRIREKMLALQNNISSKS